MPVHGVGAAAAHRPQFTQSAQRGNRPAAPQPAAQDGAATAAVSPATGHQPPAHGVRRLLAEGHFDGKNSYEHLVAKFGPPPTVTEEITLESTEDPGTPEPLLDIDQLALALELPLETEPPVTQPEEEPTIEQLIPDEIVPQAPQPSTTGLLDIDALLMEELVNEQSLVGQFIDPVNPTNDPTDDTQTAPDLAA